jgi:hypothetical protein
LPTYNQEIEIRSPQRVNLFKNITHTLLHKEWPWIVVYVSLIAVGAIVPNILGLDPISNSVASFAFSLAETAVGYLAMYKVVTHHLEVPVGS